MVQVPRLRQQTLRQRLASAVPAWWWRVTRKWRWKHRGWTTYAPMSRDDEATGYGPNRVPPHWGRLDVRLRSWRGRRLFERDFRKDNKKARR
jgi:hypothetical protein